MSTLVCRRAEFLSEVSVCADLLLALLCYVDCIEMYADDLCSRRGGILGEYYQMACPG